MRRRPLSMLLVIALVAGLLSSPLAAKAQDPEPPDHGPITVKAGYGHHDYEVRFDGDRYYRASTGQTST